MRGPKWSAYASRKEGAKLEFKSAAAVDDPRILPRAVCALLNAGGGEVIVGRRDDGNIDSVPDLERAGRVILDRLIESIAPRLPANVAVDKFEDAPALLVTVPKPPQNSLFALRSTQGRFSVPERTGDRTQLLDWPEIVERVWKAGEKRRDPIPDMRKQREEVHDQLAKWIDDAESKAAAIRELGGLFICLRSSPPRNADASALQSRLRNAIEDPGLVGVRRDGWGFAPLRTEPIKRSAGRREWIKSGIEHEGYLRLEVDCSPTEWLRLATRLDERMLWGTTLESVRTSKTLHPYALSETVSSCMQLWAYLLRTDLVSRSRAGDTEPPETVWGGLQLTRLRGRTLRPYRPGIVGFDFDHLSKTHEEDNVGPFVREIPGDEFLSHPHRLGFELIREVYSQFGYAEDNVVPFYDRASETFVYR